MIALISTFAPTLPPSHRKTLTFAPPSSTHPFPTSSQVRHRGGKRDHIIPPAHLLQSAALCGRGVEQCWSERQSGRHRLGGVVGRTRDPPRLLHGSAEDSDDYPKHSASHRRDSAEKGSDAWPRARCAVLVEARRSTPAAVVPCCAVELLGNRGGRFFPVYGDAYIQG